MARKILCIKDYPGDLFSLITKMDDYIDQLMLIIFKEDLDKLHGFIAYEDKFSYIGINHKRPITLQNFTLAHEIGHWYLHRGKCFSDNNIETESRDSNESEAFRFGQELLYPEELFLEDYRYIVRNSLLAPSHSKQLGLYVNELCHKYFLSFNVILKRILYKSNQLPLYYTIIKAINSALDMKYTQLDSNFYIAQNSSYDKQLDAPYVYIRNLVNKAIDKQVISRATGEAVLFPYRERKGD